MRNKSPLPHVSLQVTDEQVRQLSCSLRPEDLRSLLATKPKTNTYDILKECIEVSTKSFSVLNNDTCIALFGVSNLNGVGIPWLLCSEEIFRIHARAFIKECRLWVNELTRDYHLSMNYVATTDTDAHRWLKWVGFKIDSERVIINNGREFYPFTFKGTR